MVHSGRPTVAKINRAALRENFGKIQYLAGDRAVIAVVKANAYGHGALPVAETLVAAGCARLAVLSVEEGAELRKAGIKVPILVLGGVDSAADAREAARLQLVVTIHHAGHVALLAGAGQDLGQSIGVQVEVDTGMSRMGISAPRAAELLEFVVSERALTLEGVYTHFARADETDLAATHEQIAQFKAVLKAAQAREVRPPLIHAANSAALLAYRELESALEFTNAVRVGLALYGVLPAPHFDLQLKPVMTFATRVVQVRRVKAGQAVGYGGSYRAEKETIIATLPAGYADGVPRCLGNRGFVTLRGRTHPIVGRVSMDYITIDAGEGPIAIGDEAILFGETVTGGVRVEKVAEVAETISYELLTRVGARVPRICL